jgi:hypothetical protein
VPTGVPWSGAISSMGTGSSSGAAAPTELGEMSVPLTAMDYVLPATLPSQRSADAAVNDDGLTVRSAPAAKRAPLPIPVLAGGAVAVLVAILGVFFAMRGGGGGDRQLAGGPGGSGPPPVVLTSTARPEEPTPTAVGPIGIVRIDSNPSGANIRVNGEAALRTPRQLNLKPGQHEISLFYPSYEEWTGTLQVEDGDSKSITPVLTPLPAAKSLTVTDKALGRDPFKDANSMLRLQTATDTFRLQDDVNAIVYVKPDTFGIRDLSYTTTIRWYQAGGRPIELSGQGGIKKDLDEDYIHACAPASRLDDRGSGGPLSVEILVDGEVIASFSFRVSGGNSALAPPSPCDTTTVRGPVASAPVPSPTGRGRG